MADFTSIMLADGRPCGGRRCSVAAGRRRSSSPNTAFRRAGPWPGRPDDPPGDLGDGRLSGAAAGHRDRGGAARRRARGRNRRGACRRVGFLSNVWTLAPRKDKAPPGIRKRTSTQRVVAVALTLIMTMAALAAGVLAAFGV